MSKQLHEKQQDLDLDVQNKHFVEAPDNTVRYITTEQLLGGLRMFDYAITRNLQVGVDPTTFTHYDTTDGIGSNLVNRVYVNGNTVYAATEGGLSISTDGGLTYTNYTTADGLGSNAVNDVVSASSYVYAATDAGLSISSNSGVTYTNYTTANGLLNNQCNFVYYYNGTLYVATSSGVSKTTDNATFTTVTSSYTGQMHVDGSVFYIAVNSAFLGGGLNKSTDGGVTWSFVNSAGGSVEAHKSVFCSGANVYATYYVAIAGTFTRWITISTDSGVTWTRKQIGVASNLILNYIFVNGGKIYVTEQDSALLNNGMLYISSDGGVNYTSYDTTNGMGSDSLTSVFVLNGKCFVSSYQTTVGGVSVSSSIWQRIKTGSGTLIEHDIATNSIDEYATASGSAGSTATLTQISSKRIDQILHYLKNIFTSSVSPTISSTCSASNGVGILGVSNTGATAIGVSGTSSSGVGVAGTSTASNGIGVAGQADTGSTAKGVSGISASGYGIYGTSGAAVGAGVYGSNSASNGIGVEGVANTGATAKGVSGSSSSGTGVSGTSTASNGVGVTGVSNTGASAAGVSGSSSSGTGVSGTSTASNGAGVTGVSNTGATAKGVYGTSTSGFGVYGNSSADAGVAGVSTVSNGAGVGGQADTGATAKGVYGQSASGYGVYGLSTATNGVGMAGVANTGATAVGVSGSSSSGAGVAGVSTATNGTGIGGQSDTGTTAIGVHGVSAAGRGVQGTGATYDFYAAGAGTNYGPFTGSHEITIPSALNPERGMILAVDYTRQRIFNNEISLSSTFPHCKLAAQGDTAYCIFNTSVDYPATHWANQEANQKYAIGNALGEGWLLAANNAGDIVKGDILVLSSIQGFAEKLPADTILTASIYSKILGKVLDNVDWINAQQIQGTSYKKALVPVIYQMG